MKLQTIIPIIFLIIFPFAANAEFTTISGYDSFGNSFNAIEYNFDNDYVYDLDF